MATDTKIVQKNITHRDGSYFVCGYCGTGCFHGTYCGCGESRREVRGEEPKALSCDDIHVEAW